MSPYDQVSQLRQTVISAQEAILEYIVPDGITAEEAISKLILLLDNPETIEILANSRFQVDPK